MAEVAQEKQHPLSHYKNRRLACMSTVISNLSVGSCRVASVLYGLFNTFCENVCGRLSVLTERIILLFLGVVAMHIETIENVYKESKKLPPIHKVSQKAIENDLSKLPIKTRWAMPLGRVLID